MIKTYAQLVKAEARGKTIVLATCFTLPVSKAKQEARKAARGGKVIPVEKPKAE